MKKVHTVGWPGPQGLCDICNKRKAVGWFGDTSVALCDNEECHRITQSKWERMLEEINEQESYD